MPTCHFDRRQLRRTAWVTLVVWLFALAAGVVNACALAPAGSAARGVSPVSHVDIAAHDAAEGTLVSVGHDGDHDQVGPVSSHTHGHDAGKDSCLKFCDDESSAIAKVKLPVVDLGAGLLTVVEAWNPIAALGSLGVRRARERPGAQGPPLVIRFLRLIL
jgi:hypothetical protein